MHESCRAMRRQKMRRVQPVQQMTRQWSSGKLQDSASVSSSICSSPCAPSSPQPLELWPQLPSLHVLRSHPPSPPIPCLCLHPLVHDAGGSLRCPSGRRKKGSLRQPWLLPSIRVVHRRTRNRDHHRLCRRDVLHAVVILLQIRPIWALALEPRMAQMLLRLLPRRAPVRA